MTGMTKYLENVGMFPFVIQNAPAVSVIEEMVKLDSPGCPAILAMVAIFEYLFAEI